MVAVVSSVLKPLDLWWENRFGLVVPRQINEGVNVRVTPFPSATPPFRDERDESIEKVPVSLFDSLGEVNRELLCLYGKELSFGIWR
jgi:hypothetical protein